MRRKLTASLVSCALPLTLLAVVGCGDANKGKTANDEKKNADNSSGPDGKRSGARAIKPNSPITDEVSFLHQDMTDWYQVDLKGKAGVLNTILHWDSESSDVMVDVFDEFGKQISASPVRKDKQSKEKSLLTPIDRPGTYYVRITAPTKTDGTVYTVEAKWDEPVAEAPPPPPPPKAHLEPMPEEPPPPKHVHHEPREPREPKEKPPAESVQGRIVSAYREGPGLTLHIDKGSAAGLKTGMSGTVLAGPAGEDALDGGEFKIVSVLDANKSVGKTSLRTIGKNTRVSITLSR